LNRPDLETPTFAEPWQAEAFALVVHLHASGAFTWTEWADSLSHQIASAGVDDGARYYENWLAALERLLADRGLADPAALAVLKQAWAEAYEHTPHGQPVTLS
jgi:nitrile hydratase accessory protein